jgi:outer membrane receptor protein involved in Fe transport
MIIWHYDSGTFTTTASNIDTAVIQGFEGSINGEAADWLRYGINFTLQRPVRVYDESYPSLVGKDLPYTPREKANLTVSLGRREVFLFDITGRYVGERYADGPNTNKLDSYVVVDSKLAKGIYYLQVENLFDVVYHESVGYHPVTWLPLKYPMPGRRILFGMKYDL